MSEYTDDRARNFGTISDWFFDDMQPGCVDGSLEHEATRDEVISAIIGFSLYFGRLAVRDDGDREFIRGFMIAIGALASDYGDDATAAFIIKAHGLRNADVSFLDEYDKERLKHVAYLGLRFRASQQPAALESVAARTMRYDGEKGMEQTVADVLATQQPAQQAAKEG